MASPSIITLTTDFGFDGSFVGQLKGAALAICPQVTLVDLCHAVPARDIEGGAYVLETGFAAFPPGTIHVAVVDPGVGTDRRAVAVRTEHYTFVAPDNGLLSRVLDREPPRVARVLTNDRYRRPQVSATFHGRDVFAPAAAWIARGVPLEELGPPAGELARLADRGRPLRVRGAVEVTVLFVDRFGNVVLDAPVDPALFAAVTAVALDTPGGTVRRLAATFGDAPPAEPFLLINSAGYLEIAVRDGNAAEQLGLARGMRLALSML